MYRGCRASVVGRVRLGALLLAFMWLASSCEREAVLVERLATAEIDTDRGQSAAFREKGPLTDEVRLSGVVKRAITPPFPAALTFPLTLPRDAELQFSVALLTERRVPRAQVAFEIELEPEGDPRVAIFRREMRAGEENQWSDARADLGAWGGERVKLTFRTTPVGTREVPWADRIATGWGDPVVRRRETTPIGSNERPSFVFILVDTLRADFLGAYGFPGRISPNLDRLAAESLLFDSCFANAPWTKPSIATLFTSVHPSVHGVRNMGSPSWSGPGDRLEVLPDEIETLAERFEAAGYDTAAFTANPFISPRYGFSQGFGTFEYEEKTEALLGSARRWLASRANDRGTPFFLYLHFMDVHGPYQAPARDVDEVLRETGSLSSRTLTEDEYSRIPAYLREVAWLEDQDPLQLSSWRARYGAGVHAFDRGIGSFLSELRTSGVLDRSYLVLTSDHGEELMEHGGWNHGTSLYDHQLHVPLLIRKPLARDAGRRITSLVSLVDLMPTLLALSGVEPPPGISGHDLSPLVQGEPMEDAGAVFAEGVLERPGVYGMRTRSGKLIWDLDRDELEMYDLFADPEERLSYGQDPSVALWKRRLLHHVAEQHEGALSPESVVPGQELRDRLRALGYVN